MTPTHKQQDQRPYHPIQPKLNISTRNLSLVNLKKLMITEKNVDIFCTWLHQEMSSDSINIQNFSVYRRVLCEVEEYANIYKTLLIHYTTAVNDTVVEDFWLTV